jgi:hypothetical protein
LRRLLVSAPTLFLFLIVIQGLYVSDPRVFMTYHHFLHLLVLCVTILRHWMWTILQGLKAPFTNTLQRPAFFLVFSIPTKIHSTTLARANQWLSQYLLPNLLHYRLLHLQRLKSSTKRISRRVHHNTPIFSTHVRTATSDSVNLLRKSM